MFGWSIFFDWLDVVYHAHFTFTDIENDTQHMRGKVLYQRLAFLYPHRYRK